MGLVPEGAKRSGVFGSVLFTENKLSLSLRILINLPPFKLG